METSSITVTRLSDATEHVFRRRTAQLIDHGFNKKAMLASIKALMTYLRDATGYTDIFYGDVQKLIREECNKVLINRDLAPFSPEEWREIIP
jgi:hypothetical protein